MGGWDTAIGAGLGLAMGEINDQRQQRQNEKLQKQNMKFSKEMADYNKELGLQQWKDTGPVGMRKELNKADMSIGLAYGGAGAGGQTASVQGGNTSGAVAKGTSEEMGMGMQMALMQAQKENIEADTANKKADAGYTGGAKTANTVADTAGKDLQNQWEQFLQGKDASGASLKETAYRVDVNKVRSDISKIDAEIATIPEYLKNDATRVKQEAQRIVIEAQNARTNEDRNRITEQIASLERSLRLSMQGHQLGEDAKNQGQQQRQHNDRMEQQDADRLMDAVEGVFNTAIPWYERRKGTTTRRTEEEYNDGEGGRTRNVYERRY